MGSAPSPTVSVTIVLHNSEHELRGCLAAIRPDLQSGFAELIAVDNASPDDSAGEVARALPAAKIIRSARNLGFAAGANLAWPHVRGRYWLLLNPDTELDEGGIEKLAAWMDANPQLGAASAELAGQLGDELPSTGRALPSPWRPLLEASRLHLLLPRRARGGILRGAYWRGGDQLDAGWVPATALMARREAIESVGLLDDRFFLYGEDIEWCWRMRQSGWSVGVCSTVHALHREGASALRTFDEAGGPPAHGSRRGRCGAEGPWRPLRADVCPRDRLGAWDRVASPRSLRRGPSEREIGGECLASRRRRTRDVTALEASVVISTFNRAEALAETLAAFAKQDVPNESYEVIVVDDGSTDDTWARLEAVSAPFSLRTVRHERNRGVSAGRNSGIRLARGRTLIFVSDDVLVPPSFVRQHVETVARMPGYWVVGAFRQRHSTSATPFGRYLQDLERGFSRGRTAGEIAPGLWEMTWPTARNLSLPRSDLDRIGLFDERFRTTCEDQDLAQRARQVGIRFVYSERIDCIHNDHVAHLARYSEFQQRGARDGPLLCAKYPVLHGRSSLARENGPISRSDGPRLVAKKAGKRVCSTPVPTAILRLSVRFLERIHAPRRVVETGYRWVIGLAIFSGWRQGLRRLESLSGGGGESEWVATASR